MDFFNLALAFIEGLALILSPCILPILPIVLSSSVAPSDETIPVNKYQRPLGVVAGFILSFTAFALFSRKLVSWLHIDPELIRNFSLGFLFLFGTILISGFLSQKFSQFTGQLASLGTKLSQKKLQGEDFFSGIFLGCLIGFVWTPCAGPILAAAIVQTIRQENDLNGFLTILFFSLGAGIPMLFIALTGKELMGRLSFFKQNSETIRKVFGFLIMAAVIFIASGGMLGLPGPKANLSKNTFTKNELVNKLAKPYAAPELQGLAAWINSEPLQLDKLKGKVILIDFWTYSCINCQRTLPYIKSWDQQYRGNGLVIIGIHAPEFEFEKKLENVQKAVEEKDLKYPVALDNKLTTWTNFKNRYWPAHYLIDKTGTVVYEHFGEGSYDETENNIRYLLGLSDKAAKESQVPKQAFMMQTPETYLGQARMKNFQSPEIIKSDKASIYTFPKYLKPDTWALKGLWKIEPEKITSAEAGAQLQFNFNAKRVFVVLGNQNNKAIRVKVTLNDNQIGTNGGQDLKDGYLDVNSNKLYEIVNLQNGNSGKLGLESEASGLEAYAFTFGN
jgi:cytochrome c biogenesis protein CcdA/thiol-disulfide isomerase/thioredoxin